MHLFLQILLIAIFSSFCLALQTRRRRKGREHFLRRPPGPPRLPIIGNLHQFVFSSCPHLYLHELSKAYGPLMSLKLGSVPILVVSSAKLAKEVMKTHDFVFSDRPEVATLKKLSYDGFDIAFGPYGEHWRQFKKVSLIHLFSNKKVRSFSSILEEVVHQMTQKISCLSYEDRVVDLSEMMVCLINSIICKIAFGRSYDSGRHAECGRSFQDMLKDVDEMLISFCFSDYFPSLGWVLDKLTGMSTRLHKIFMEFDGFYENVIDEHLYSIGPKDGQEDIVDVLLELQRETSLGINITKDHIKGILMNIFVAGTDTSASTVVWAMTELMKNPEAMKRAQQEARTLMKNRIKDIIKEEDLGKLVYLKAVVKETLRLHPVVPLVLRGTSQRCSVQGYEIQEKTVVYVSAWAIGRDPESWENPEEFLPERFLGKNKGVDFQGHDFELIPFGSGRRNCPGRQLAVAMVELALANLICLFDWEVPLGMEKEVLDTSGLPGIVLNKKNPLCLVAKKTFG